MRWCPELVAALGTSLLGLTAPPPVPAFAICPRAGTSAVGKNHGNYQYVAQISSKDMLLSSFDLFIFDTFLSKMRFGHRQMDAKYYTNP